MSIILPGLMPPHGHYSHAVIHQGVVYVSGILGNAGATSTGTPRPLHAQVRHCLDALDQVLAGVGSNRAAVIRVTVYASDVEHWPLINECCEEFFGAHRPARTVVPCGPLRLGSLVEIDGIAAVVSHVAAPAHASREP